MNGDNAAVVHGRENKVWFSIDVQSKLDGATRTKPVFEGIQREMAAAGYDRTLDQIYNKLKKLKKEYRDQKRELFWT